MNATSRIVGMLVITALILSTMASTGTAQNDMSAIVPAIASFFIPGSGQLINDQPNKALTHFVVGVGISSIYYFPAINTSPMNRLVVPVYLAWSGYSAYDAYHVADDRRRGIFGSSLELEEPEKARLDTADLRLSDSASSSELSVSRNFG
ncbi:MAG: hypothetical protein ACLFN7_01845 [Candidatus Acetothermia bacterium]